MGFNRTVENRKYYGFFLLGSNCTIGMLDYKKLVSNALKLPTFKSPVNTVGLEAKNGCKF